MVGVVKEYGLDTNTRMVVYFPHAQVPAGTMYVVAHGTADPSATSDAMTHLVTSINPNVPVSDIATMAKRVQDSMARQRFAMTMLCGFGGFALVLAAIGVYGVMSFLLTQGTGDIAIRMALGARRVSILSRIFGQGMRLAFVGLAAGLIGALALTRIMSSLLFGMKPTDPITFLSGLILLFLAALSACLFPATRAMRIDPMIALRAE